MKVHAGVDVGSGYVHTITGISANMHDVTETANLFRDDDEVVYGDSGYLGTVNQPSIKNDVKKSGIEFRVNKLPSSLKMSNDFKDLNWDKTRRKWDTRKLYIAQLQKYASILYVICQYKPINVYRADRTKDFIGCTV